MATILIMPAKMATLDLLKIKAFLNKGYGVIISDHDINKKILSNGTITVQLFRVAKAN